jgi:ribosome modulation factor
MNILYIVSPIIIFLGLILLLIDQIFNKPKWDKAIKKHEIHLQSVDIDGESAFWNGITRDKVPYIIGTDEHRAWIEGWESAQCDKLYDDNN